MKRSIVETKKAPPPVGPYSQAIQAGNMVFVSGQIALHPETNEIPEDFTSQCHQVLKNLQAILEASGSSLEHTVKVMIYMTDIDRFNELNEIYEGYLGSAKPARACVEVSRLPKGVLVEMDAVALIKE
jgi:2-iminobutanoate/2-iminopropanoate deaminase